MSYILDALRRAEAERERGNVPGLHTQPVAAPAATPASGRVPPALLWGGGGLVLLLLVGALAWLLLTRPTAPVAAPVAVPVAAPQPLPPPPAVVAAAPVTPAEALKVVPIAPTPAPAAAPATRASAAAIVPIERLPEAQRRQLPALAVSGAIWSESAANRMLIVSGQLLHEGEAVAPGVVLEQIRPKSAVLRKGELRYEISF